MVHIKRGVVAHAKHKKILNQVKGYYGSRSRNYRVAFQAAIKAKQYAYRDRRQNKRQFRKLWIMHINAAVRQYDMSYSKFIYNLKIKSILINRKMLANILKLEPNIFSNLIENIR